MFVFNKVDGAEDCLAVLYDSLLSNKSTIVGRSGSNLTSSQALTSVDYLRVYHPTYNPGSIQWFEPGGAGTVYLSIIGLGSGKPVDNTVKMYLVFSDVPATP